MNELKQELKHYCDLLIKSEDREICLFIAGRIIDTANKIKLDLNKCAESDISAVLDFINNNSPVKKSHVTYRLQPIGDAKYLTELLDRLVSSGKIATNRVGNKTIYSKHHE